MAGAGFRGARIDPGAGGRIYVLSYSYPVELAMPFHVRNRETERLARELARSAKLGLTEAVHLALSNELGRRKRAIPLWDRVAELRKRVRARVKDTRPITKEFRDDLYDAKG
jgi:antitoxin VapB